MAGICGVFDKNLQENILKSKVLVVGAGGIGCEVLKNLVLSGFSDIEIIDLDTIDLSNLNRQFLFHREHVGKSKAMVARQSALEFNPDVNIKAYHDSITSTDYGVNFFKKFSIVLSALDNRQARNHVNRMCLNADVPLIESGTAGYNGQVELIRKGLTQCYECTPKSAQKTYPGCTIRNTPSEPIHCIVWAKHLFNQLFGETADDEDISPDVADPEAGAGGDSNLNDGNVARVSTRQWVKEAKYDVEALFNKFFHDDINYLLSMSNLWKSRKPPTPLKWDNVLLDEKENCSESLRQYHKLWNLSECAAVFADCMKKLKDSHGKLEENDYLIWDKDDQPAMDFVAACANIRSYIFGIEKKSRFEIKSMAGNIIPAIATTNAMTAGIVVLHAFKVLEGEQEKCKTVYVRSRLNPRNQCLVPEKHLTKPNPNCYVCSSDPAINLRIDTNKMKIKDLREEVLKKSLNMIDPDVIIASVGAVVISSDEDETESNDDKFLNEMKIVDGVILKADDFVQNYELSIIIVHFDAGRDDSLFEVIAGKTQLKPKEAEEKIAELTIEDGPSSSKRARIKDDDDDLVLVEDEDDENMSATNNAVPSSSSTNNSKQNSDNNNDNDLITIIDDDDDIQDGEEFMANDYRKNSISPAKASIGGKRKPPGSVEYENSTNKNDDNDGPSKIKRSKTPKVN